MTRPLLTPALILDQTADWYRIPREMLRSQRRATRYARPRQVAMWLAAQLLPSRSLPRLGRDFDRDHTTVLHAVTMVEKRRQDATFAADVDALRRFILDTSEPPCGPLELALRVAEDLADAFRAAVMAYAAADPMGFLDRYAKLPPKPQPKETPDA
ncbi:MAG: hypothetical protein JXQ84_07745 [Rhodospirillaceae bacterium]|nr:hypothetical protein [Rhodospirillaceae bacterium]